MSLFKQVVAAAVVLGAVGSGALFHYRSAPESGAEAAVGRGPEAVPVEITRAAAGTMRERIEAVGTTLARQAVDIVPLTSGRVAAIELRPGQPVAAGAVLVRLDEQMEQAAVSEAQAALREAELALERARKLRTNNTVAQATVDELEAAFAGARARLDGAEKQLADRTVRAPFAGVVGMRRVDVGARVDDDDRADHARRPRRGRDRVRRAGDLLRPGAPGPDGERDQRGVSGPDLQRPHRHDRHPGRPGLARFSGARGDPESRSGPAGRHVHARQRGPGAAAGGADPGAGGAGRGRQHLRVHGADERAERRKVRLGQREAGTVEVLDGVAAGDVVVESGLQRLRDGIAVRVAGAADAAAPAAGGSDG